MDSAFIKFQLSDFVEVFDLRLEALELFVEFVDVEFVLVIFVL